jgi:polysaccharide deacetylase family protein (PEP-CTERM system associated)
VPRPVDVWHLKCETRVQRTASHHPPSPDNRLTTHFFTVDVEEYFQVRALESVVNRDEWHSRPSRVGESVDGLLAMLDRHGAKGTFFVLGWLADRRPEVVRSIASAGHEVASHGYWHEPITTLDQKRFRADLRASRDAIENIIGERVIGYRAPNFSITPGLEWAFDILIEEGFEYDSSLFPFRRRGYGYPGAPSAPHIITRGCGSLREFPLATTRLLNYTVPAAGGGYLRHFPLAVVRRALREATERDEPATFYIHPWEIDPGQPRLAVSAVNRVRHYRGLGATLGRMEKLLSEFRFGSIASYTRSGSHSSTLMAAHGAA